MFDLIGSLLSGGGTVYVLVAELMVVILAFALPNKVVRGAGVTIGVVISKVLRQKAGKGAGEKVESYFQGTLASLMDGINEGLDRDDKE
uniref:Uncharacterized protein n=1 Tax=viral metagenome TaxID=1070528 RepID=A0A6M3KW06_9ZZZZ